MAEKSHNNEPLAQSLEQFQKVMETDQPYLKTWTEFP